MDESEGAHRQRHRLEQAEEAVATARAKEAEARVIAEQTPKERDELRGELETEITSKANCQRAAEQKMRVAEEALKDEMARNADEKAIATAALQEKARLREELEEQRAAMADKDAAFAKLAADQEAFRVKESEQTTKNRCNG